MPWRCTGALAPATIHGGHLRERHDGLGWQWLPVAVTVLLLVAAGSAGRAGPAQAQAHNFECTGTSVFLESTFKDQINPKRQTAGPPEGGSPELDLDWHVRGRVSGQLELTGQVRSGQVRSAESRSA
jgi:hypothetical protein